MPFVVPDSPGQHKTKNSQAPQAELLHQSPQMGAEWFLLNKWLCSLWEYKKRTKNKRRIRRWEKRGGGGERGVWGGEGGGVGGGEGGGYGCKQRCVVMFPISCLAYYANNSQMCTLKIFGAIQTLDHQISGYRRLHYKEISSNTSKTNIATKDFQLLIIYCISCTLTTPLHVVHKRQHH